MACKSREEERHDGRIMLIYMQRLGTGNLYQITEPLGLKVLSAFVEERGYECIVFSGSVHEAVPAVQVELNEKGLHGIGLYCDYENCSAVESFCRVAKTRWSLRVFVGGPQAVALGEEFLKNSGCDALVRGEGEYPLFELLEFFLHGRGSREEIAGVSYLNGEGHMVSVPPRPPLASLDDLPVGKLRNDLSVRGNERSLAVLTGRGCPFRCAFCYEGSVPGKVRLRSVSHVMDEIRRALDSDPDIKFIWFADDTFTLDPRRMEAFSRGLAALRAEHDFVWFCECHPSALIKWPQTLPMMVESGLVRMQIGIESGCSSVVQLYRKQTTPETIADIVGLCMESGLAQLAGNIIIGGAAETRETFEETLRFTTRLLQLGPGMLDLTSTFFLPLPGTAIIRNPPAFGIRILDRNSLTALGDVAVVETQGLSREQITAMRFQFTNHVCETMLGIHKEGKVPEERVRSQYVLKLRYGIESIWYKAVYAESCDLRKRYGDHGFEKSPRPSPYHILMQRGAVRRSEDVATADLEGWRPQRTMDLWASVDFAGGYPRIGQYVLSPLEYQLLLHSAGKLTLQQLLETVFSQFRDRFEAYESFRETALPILKGFEKKLWLAYAEI